MSGAWLVLSCGLLVAAACGNDGGSGGPAGGQADSLDTWCETANESLPALVFTSAEALDDPGRQAELELEAVEAHRNHYERLADAPEGVPEPVATNAAQLATTFDAMHAEVAAGARLPTVVGEAEQTEALTAKVTAFATQVEETCR